MAKIRIGILCDELVFPGWQAELLRSMLTDDRYDVALVVRNRFRASLAMKLRKRRLSTGLFRVLDAVEGTLTAPFSPVRYVDQVVSLESALSSVPLLEVLPQVSPSGLVHRLGPEDCARIREHDCDVLVRFGFNILRGEVLGCARHGIWSFHHADNEVNRGGPAGFWEWYHDDPYSGSMVQILGENLDCGDVVNRAKYLTFRYSWNENRRRMFDRSRSLLTDSLARLAAGEELRPLASNPFYDKPLFRPPGLAQMAKAGIRYVTRLAVRSIDRTLFKFQWGIALGNLTSPSVELRKFGPMVFPRGDRFWADPFLVRRDGKDYVFVEEFLYGPGRGRITCLTFEEDRLTSATPVIEREYHLSYPSLLELEGTLYLCPETLAANRIEIYRCDEFPHRWSSAGTLVEGIEAVDPSLHYLNGKWWLFANVGRNRLGDCGYELHLFSADNPLGSQWKPHPRNPVVQTAEYGRNGGGVVEMNGRLFRVCQGADLRGYGSNLVFREITKFDDETYREHPVQKVFPDWNRSLIGTHHFALSGERVAIDGHRRKLRLLP